jgi:hypothetical protein
MTPFPAGNLKRKLSDNNLCFVKVITLVLNLISKLERGTHRSFQHLGMLACSTPHYGDSVKHDCNKMCGRVEMLLAFTTTDIDVGEGSDTRFARFTHREKAPGYY